LEIPDPVIPGDRMAVQVGHGEPVEISVEACRNMGNGKHLVVGCPIEPLAELVPAKEVLGQRRHPRSRLCLRVMSPDLPGYVAMTMDCSDSGLQLETHQPLLVGEILHLQLGGVSRRKAGRRHSRRKPKVDRQHGLRSEQPVRAGAMAVNPDRG